MCCLRYFVMLGSLLAGLGVVAGAFGAHGLEGHFGEKYQDMEPKVVAGVSVPASQKYYDDYRTAVTYQMWHALALLAVGLAAAFRPRRAYLIAGWSFLLGTVLFSGSLYILTIAGPKWLGVTWGLVTPFGGLLLIVGWVALVIGSYPSLPDPQSNPMLKIGH